MNRLLKVLLERYPGYESFIMDAWGDEDYFGDEKTDEEMQYNIEIAVERMIAAKDDKEERDD